MNSNSNSNAKSTGDWKNRIPEGNWRTPPTPPPTSPSPQMQSTTAWSYQTSMKETSFDSKNRTVSTPPIPSRGGGVWSNNRRNKNTMIITTPQTPIKKKARRHRWLWQPF